MKKQIFMILAFTAIMGSARAYDFSAIAPTGQTLYYNINGANAIITSQNSDYPYYTSYPTGALTIPSTVTYGNATYSVTSIADMAFYNCSRLTSVIMPNSITTIGDGAFHSCRGLISITISDSVTSIGWTTFADCTGLTSIFIPNSVTSINNGAFWNCTGLTSVSIGNSVTSIGQGVFYGCNNLTSITIPSSVISIGDSTFNYCSQLHSVVCKSNIPPLGNGNIPTSAIINIPCNTTNRYTTSWGGDYIYQEYFPYEINTSAIDSTQGTVAVLQHPSCFDGQAIIIAAPSIGYHFLHWNDGNNINPRTILVMGDTSFVAIFDTNCIYMVTATNCLGAGAYQRGATAVVMAAPQPNMRFLGWSDGIGSNPRSITVSSDTTVTPIYVPFETDTVIMYDTLVVYDTIINVIHDTSEYNHFFSDTITVTRYVFDTVRIYDTLTVVNMDTLRHYYYDTTRMYDTLTVVNLDTLHHYYFDTTVSVDTLHHYHYDTTRVTNIVYDTTAVTRYTFDTIWMYDTLIVVNIDTLHHHYYDTMVIRTIYDTTSITHYFFDTTWVYDTIYLYDTVYVNSNGIDGAAPADVRVYTSHTEIVVEGAEGMAVRLYDISGRLLERRNEGEDRVKFLAPASGTYVLRIGDRTVRKVVVIR